MFRNWGFLITEMVGLLIIAALLGLFVGWLIWARRRRDTHSSHIQQDNGRLAQLQGDLDACRASHADKDQKIAHLEAELNHMTRASIAAEVAPGLAAAAVSAPEDDARGYGADEDATRHAAEEAPASHAAASAASAEDAAGDAGMVDYDGDGVLEGTNEGTRPETLSAPRGGQADDLKRIKGIGPKLEQLCHKLGFYHFDQIANWTADEVAWVNANLEGFKGRVSRDNWVEQAKTLAAGGDTEFSRRVDKGGVY